MEQQAGCQSVLRFMTTFQSAVRCINTFQQRGSDSRAHNTCRNFLKILPNLVCTHLCAFTQTLLRGRTFRQSQNQVLLAVQGYKQCCRWQLHTAHNNTAYFKWSYRWNIVKDRQQQQGDYQTGHFMRSSRIITSADAFSNPEIKPASLDPYRSQD